MERDIKDRLVKLHGTLMTVETKGYNTMVMTDSLRFIEKMVKDIDEHLAAQTPMSDDIEK